MVSLHPKLIVWQHDVEEKGRQHCRYCNARPEMIYLLTKTQDFICESCHKQYDILISNSRVELPENESSINNPKRYVSGM
jgi:hypothetical protein